MDNAVLTIILVIVGVYLLLVVLALALGLLEFTIKGAVIIFDYASEQGFIGLAVYFVLWIAFFPFMLAACFGLGLLARREDH